MQSSHFPRDEDLPQASRSDAAIAEQSCAERIQSQGSLRWKCDSLCLPSPETSGRRQWSGVYSCSLTVITYLTTPLQYLVDLSDVQRTVPVDENTRGVVKVVLTRTSGATIRPSFVSSVPLMHREFNPKHQRHKGSYERSEDHG